MLAIRSPLINSAVPFAIAIAICNKQTNLWSAPQCPAWSSPGVSSGLLSCNAPGIRSMIGPILCLLLNISSHQSFKQMYQNNVEWQLVHTNAVHFDKVRVVELFHYFHLFHEVLKVKVFFQGILRGQKEHSQPAMYWFNGNASSKKFMIFSLRFSLSHICLLDCILLLADPLFLNSSLPCPFQVAPALTETSSHLWCEYSWWWWWCNWKLFSGASSSSPPRSWSPPWRQHLCPSTCQNWPPQSCRGQSPSNLSPLA